MGGPPDIKVLALVLYSILHGLQFIAKNSCEFFRLYYVLTMGVKDLIIVDIIEATPQLLAGDLCRL